MPKTANCRRCRRPSSSISPSSAATAPPASSTKARCCSSGWRRRRCARDGLEGLIAEALDGHLCRCTGYVKYHEAVRAVILADAKRYLVQRAARMSAETSHKALVVAAALGMSMLTAYAAGAGRHRTGLAAPQSFDGIADRRCALRGDLHRTRQGADASALHELPSGRRPPAPGRCTPSASSRR